MDDGLLQRFQILIYPEFSSDWENIDRSPNLIAQEQVFEIFKKIDGVEVKKDSYPGVNFCPAAQDVFNVWRKELEKRVRKEEGFCPAFESHLSKYRSLMPALALLFWILEDPNNINGSGAVSLSAATSAVEWCSFLERHAAKTYAIGQNAQSIAAIKLAAFIEKGLVVNDMPVRSIYRKQWAQLRTPPLVDHALEILQEHKWLRIVYATAQGGRTKKIEIHPKFRRSYRGENYEYEITTNHNGTIEDHTNTYRKPFLGTNHHQI